MSGGKPSKLVNGVDSPKTFKCTCILLCIMHFFAQIFEGKIRMHIKHGHKDNVAQG